MSPLAEKIEKITRNRLKPLKEFLRDEEGRILDEHLLGVGLETGGLLLVGKGTLDTLTGWSSCPLLDLPGDMRSSCGVKLTEVIEIVGGFVMVGLGRALTEEERKK